MRDDVFWIPLKQGGRLGTMPRPSGGERLEPELRDLARGGVQVLVSALERHEAWELELDREAFLCREQRIRFISFPIPDRGVPSSTRDFWTVTAELATSLTQGENVVVHCRAGVGRSSLLAAGVLAHRGMSAVEAFAAIQAVRGIPVPDVPAQAEWLESAIASCLQQHPSDGAA